MGYKAWLWNCTGIQEWYKGHQSFAGAETSKGCEGSKKGFRKWDISKRKMKEYGGQLLNGVGDLVMKVKKKNRGTVSSSPLSLLARSALGLL